MIFVTVGSVLPFERLIRAVDDWAGSRRRTDVFAQIGKGRYRPNNMRWTHVLGQSEFHQTFLKAETVVAHAGVATIVTAIELGKPLLVMPRLAALKEHTSDHQVATANRFARKCGIAVARDETALLSNLDRLEEIKMSVRRTSVTAPQLIEAIQCFIDGENINMKDDARQITRM